ncbi:MAG: hypothetical protein EU532_08395 [Promethearchaeota archaeon]|nr:MAG: hypothetical protein EU532_08395 [Candidatus Lokiarchaeota archaeon]
MNESKLFTDSKRLNIAIISLIFLDLIILIMGLVYVITGAFQSYHVDYLGITESQVRNFNSRLMILISFFIRMVGFGFVSVSIGGLIIIFASFKKREKWSWILYLFQHLLIAIPLIWITLVIGGLSLILVIIGWILLIVGMILSYKEFFK